MVRINDIPVDVLILAVVIVPPFLMCLLIFPSEIYTSCRGNALCLENILNNSRQTSSSINPPYTSPGYLSRDVPSHVFLPAVPSLHTL